MKFGQATKLDKRNKTTLKKFDNDVISKNCDVIAIFPIYGQFGAIWKPDSGRIVCKTCISINSNSLFYEKCKFDVSKSTIVFIIASDRTNRQLS